VNNMTITNLYAKYLLADRLNKIAKDAGVSVDSMRLDDGSKYDPDVHLQCSAHDRRDGEGGNDAERAAIRLLDTLPSLNLERSDGLIYLRGTTTTGLTYRFYTGAGSCELVQVGTRIVRAEEAKPEREEPVYEVRCIDDLAGLVQA
jgi:hypothetical protein